MGGGEREKGRRQVVCYEVASLFEPLTPIERGRQKLFFGELFESQEVSCTVSLCERGRQGLLATDEEDDETSDINLRDFLMEKLMKILI